MNLAKKKELAARTLNVGKSRVTFVRARLDEIKEAITRQDIRDLKASGAIYIKEPSGRKKNVKRKHRRRTGKIKKKVSKRKKDYVIMTRKLRKYISELKKQGKISNEEFKDIRKNIRNKIFKSKSHLKERIKLGKE